MGANAQNREWRRHWRTDVQCSGGECAATGDARQVRNAVEAEPSAGRLEQLRSGDAEERWKRSGIELRRCRCTHHRGKTREAKGKIL